MSGKRYILLRVLAIGLALGVVLFRLVSSPEPAEVGVIEPFWQNLSYYQIVYLLADDSRVVNSPMEPSNLQEKLAAQIVYTWEEVLARAQAAPIGVLIIHDSALPLIDRAWVANAYRRGVVIAGFNLYGPQMAELVNDPCLTRDNFGIEPYPGSFYVMASLSINGPGPGGVALVEDSYRSSCSEVSRSNGRSTYELNNDDDFIFFAHAVVNHLKSR